ncbi:MAG: DeoR/GlpR family DNA-binding transcription regulator [Planctomycetota bacterium]|nr:DeoR/GlpR family DNA-binding transcription regulator [Planctomycetota bacterium]
MNTFAHRKNKILSRLNASGEVAVNDLAKILRCSEMTIRRDLQKMEAEGLVERTHGGAVATRMIRMEFAMSERLKEHRAEKTAIGQAAAKLVQPGQRIFIDTGTTTLALAIALRAAKNLCAVTTSLAVASALMPAQGIECMIVGGTLRASSPDLVGPLMEENLSRLHADLAFIGCDALSPKGELMTDDPGAARAAALMVRNASQAILLTDSSKAGRKAFVAFAGFDDLDFLVTDAGMPEEILNLARAKGVEVIVAQGEP